MAKKLFIVDGMAHIYRAFFAVRGLATSTGIPTNAVFGFISILRKVIGDYKPDYIVVAMDSKEPSFRQELYAEYKANREVMPEDLQTQIPYIFKACDVLGVTTARVSGFEADDLIGTLARKATEQGIDTVIVSNDKDMTQLVNDHVSILRLDNKSGKMILCGKAEVVEWMGVEPEKVVDVLSLWGDSSDNIPGAPGIGEKGAVQIIQQFGTLDAALEGFAEVKRRVYSESLRDHRDRILLAKQLVTIHQDAPVDLDLAAVAARPPDTAAAYALFAELEFKALMREFSAGATAARAAAPVQTIEVKRTYRQISKADEALKFIDSLFAHDSFAIAVDEQNGAFGGCSVSLGPGQAVKLDQELILNSLQVGEALAEMLENGLVTKQVHDAKRALYTLNRPLHAYGPGEDLLSQTVEGLPFGKKVRFEGLNDDVMLAAYLLNANLKQEEYALPALALNYLGVGETEFKDHDPADLTSRLARMLRGRLEMDELTSIYETMELPLVDVLFDMECAGVKIDPQPLTDLEKEIHVALDRLTGQIHSLAGQEFNINSPQQVGEIFEKLNYDVSKKTTTGKISTSAEVLEELAETYELPRLILEFREYEKLLNTYVTVLPRMVNGQTHRLHTTFNQAATATGRLSSTKPNLQNIPIRTEFGRRTRRAFVAEDGNILIAADYSQIELRLLAHITGDPVMTEAFLHNEDIHTKTARAVFGAQTPEELKQARRLAKATNFGIAYGVGAFGLARNVGISRKEAKKAIDSYFATYPGIKRYMEETPEKGRETGYVRTMFGRMRRFPDLTSRNYTVRSRAEREAINAPIQGAAADLMKLAMIRIAEQFKTEDLKTRMLLQVHDEILFEAPKDEAEHVATIVKETMETVHQLNVPLVAEVHMGDNWLDAK
ncbi:MAG TPA: DNA polymerase I [Acidobacteriota bacterium]|nr:DNA polymerase I [Acidobacteriota bacterium]